MDESKVQAVATASAVAVLDGVDQQLIEQLADRARSEGLQLTGEGGLPARLTKRAVEIEVPRDRDVSVEPTMVKKRQRRLSGVDDLVISLSAKGLTHGEICAHLAEIYGAQVSKQTISTITDRVMDGMAEWGEPAADPVYPVIFIDCIHVKIREVRAAAGGRVELDAPVVRQVHRPPRRVVETRIHRVRAEVATVERRDGLGDRSWCDLLVLR